MANILNLLILVCFSSVFMGCVSRNRIQQDEQYDFISTKCDVGDELEIGYPVPVITKIQNGDVLYAYCVYRYNIEKSEWEEEHHSEQSLIVSGDGAVLGVMSDNNEDFSTLSSLLKSKFIKIKVIKKGLFLIKVFVEVSTMTEETDFYPKLISSLVISTIIDSRNSPPPLQYRIIPKDARE